MSQSKRLFCVLPAVFAASLYADVAITSGTVTSNYASGGAPTSATLQIQGTGFTLAGSGLTGNITRATANRADQDVASVTFDPNMSETLSGPPAVFGGNVMQLLYSGTTYTDQNGNYIVITMRFSGPQLTAPNTAALTPTGNYGASAANLPFSMTGTLSVHSGSATGPLIVTVPLSGVGLYSAAQQGNGAGIVSSSRATYQFRAASPTRFGLDTNTQGLWSGTFGTDGYLIANGESNFPSYAQVTFAGETRYTWATQTTDPRALLNGDQATLGIASAYTQIPSTTFTINVNLNDGKTHRVGIYLLDWDSFSRVETITIKDAATGAVLDTETLSNFHEGYYAYWNLQGDFTISITPAAGSTAVVSGLFFDPVAGNAPANFSLSAAPATIAAGLLGSSTVTVNPLSGDPSTVSLSTLNWPAGITGSFGTNPTANSSTIAISVGADVPPGAYSLIVRGTSGVTSANGRLSLTVTAASAAGFAVSASDVSVAAGSVGVSTLTSNSANAAGDAGNTITAAGAWPAGIVLASTNGSSTVTLNVSVWVTPGQYALPITVHNGGLNSDAVTSIALTVTAAPVLDSSAAYVGSDTTTQGAWNGKYGADGFMIAGGGSSLPAYASVSVTAADTFTWAGVTDDIRALQSGVGATTGIASSYFSKTFNISVAMGDGNVHQVGLYLLDWDSTNRVEGVVITDTTTGAILDQQSFSNFHDGQWVVWNAKGNLTIAVTTKVPAFDAVFSGIYFDPPNAAPASAARISGRVR